MKSKKGRGTFMSNHYMFFDGSLGAGGAERVISLLSKELVQNPDNEVQIIIYYDQEPFYDIDERVQLIQLQRETGGTNIIKNLLCLRRHFKKHDGIILSFLAPFNILALIAHTGLAIPIIVADRNDPREIPSNIVVRKLRDFLYRFANGIVVQTKRNQEYFSKQVREKSTVIFNPIDLGEKAGLALRTEKKKQIVTVARLMPQKNHKLIIDAFEKITSEFPEYEVMFYGDGPEKDNLQQYVDNKGLSGKIHLCGNISDVPDRISEATLFVLSSDYEGMPNALIEAMCVGLPVISTKVSGATDLIADGKNGLLVDVGNAEGMADAIRKLLIDETTRNSLAANAVQTNMQLETSKILGAWKRYIEKVMRE